jgi:hypothetical protein
MLSPDARICPLCIGPDSEGVLTTRGKMVTWSHGRGTRLLRDHLVASTFYTFKWHIHSHVLPIDPFPGVEQGVRMGGVPLPMLYLEQILQGAGYVHTYW